MDEKRKTWLPHHPTARRLIQLYSALLHNAYLKGFIEGGIYQGKAKFACVPGFNCYSCPGAVGACPLGSIQNALGSSGHRAGWYVIGIILLYGVILGRTICGWLCPLGLIQELLHHIPTFKIRKSRVTRALTWLKYIILAIFVVALPLWYGVAHGIPVPGFCKYICPAGTLEGAVGLLSNANNTGLFGLLGILFTRKFVIMLVIGLACVFCYRGFCRFLCPLGTIYGLFNRFSLVGVRVDTARCSGCGSCVNNCGMDVRRVGDHECIHCAKCMDVCAREAISLKAGKTAWKVPEEALSEEEQVRRKRNGRIKRGVALAALCFALVWFNFLDPAVRSETKSADDPAERVVREDWDIPFAIGTADDLVWKIVDGSSTLPQTIVLNRRGEVSYSRHLLSHSIEYDKLSLVKELRQGWFAGTSYSEAGFRAWDSAIAPAMPHPFTAVPDGSGTSGTEA